MISFPTDSKSASEFAMFEWKLHKMALKNKEKVSNQVYEKYIWIRFLFWDILYFMQGRGDGARAQSNDW